MYRSLGIKSARLVAFRLPLNFVASVLILAATSVATTAQTAAPPPLNATNHETPGAVQRFWTAKRFIEAKPIELRPSSDHRLDFTSSASRDETPIAGDGAPPPNNKAPSLATQLHPPQPLTSNAPSEGDSRNSSSYGAYFTTGRVFPRAVPTYPYLTGGRLISHNPQTNVNIICSAAVLRPRIVITAGHCVYHAGPTQDDAGRKKYFYTNFLFVPAYANGTAPVGVWDWQYVLVSGFWSGGNGSVPNQQDMAIFEMRDNSNVKIGSYTGYLGYQTGLLNPNHLTILGYPCNLDNCAKMQETTAQSFANGGANTVTYGSAARGGSSGGPWVSDFGVAGAGAPIPVSGGYNRLKAVTSYGPTATEPKYLGASIFMSNGASSFLGLLNTVCAHRAGNC
jgi:V8-like Glu-specific endopeptidase